MEEKKIDLSIIILSHNSKADLVRLLPSIFESKVKFNYQVIVVDNASNDGTQDWLEELIGKSENRKIRLIRNLNNGFAKGNNLGIKEAQGQYLLILNPDTELKTKTLQAMMNFMESWPDVGIGTCKVLLPNGKLDLACRRRFPNPWNSFKRLFLLSKRDYNFMEVDENKSMEIDSCMGAFMFIRRAILEKTGLFDKDFFMYGEDIDLCWRFKEAGFKVWYYPETSIIHYKGSSSRKVPYKALKWFHDGMWIFYKKHYQANHPFILSLLVYLGIYSRLALLWLVNAFRKEKFVSK